MTYLVEPLLGRFAGLPMAVFGGGDSAPARRAPALASAGSPVTLVHRSEHLTARPDLVDQVRSEGRITEMAGWPSTRSLGPGSWKGDQSDQPAGERRRLDVDGVVLKLGREPRVELVRQQLHLGAHGGIVVDPALCTSRPQVFAAGDVVEGAYERIATAMGQGSLAARWSSGTSGRADVGAAGALQASEASTSSSRESRTGRRRVRDGTTCSR